MKMVEVSEPAPPVVQRLNWLAIGIGAAVILVVIVGLGLLGELGSFLSAGMVVAPFAILAALAALGERYGWARWLTYGYLILLNLTLLLGTAAFVLAALMTNGMAAPPGRLDLNAYRPALIALGWGLVMVVIGLLPLLPPVQRQLERVLPLRPGSLMNITGLSAILTLAALALSALVVLGGQPPLLTLVQASDGLGMQARPQDQIYQLAWLLPASMILVGFPIRRSFRETLVRLGVTRPSLIQIGVGIGAAVALVLAAMLIDPAIARLWEALGWPRTDSHAVQKLMTGLISPLGAAIIGITAGLGEEVAVRGVLQPRLGLVVANVVFTAAHAFQYSWDGLLIVFLIGMALGLLRTRTNTTTSAIAHGVYDFILVLASSFGF